MLQASVFYIQKRELKALFLTTTTFNNIKQINQKENSNKDNCNCSTCWRFPIIRRDNSRNHTNETN